MHMNACNILDLAEVLIEYFHKKDVHILEIGALLPRTHFPRVVSENEIPMATVFNKDLIKISSSNSTNQNSTVPAILIDTKQKLMTKQEIKELLIEGGFLK